jgi:DNA-binding SARP family transcriptional activator
VQVTQQDPLAAERFPPLARAAPLEVRLLGELQVARGGTVVPLPASKKTRALLAYLCATGRSHLRETLCELLWDGPDDPRAALRWSLTKIRPLLDGEMVRLTADRERVGFDPQGAVVDAAAVQALLAAGLDRAPLAALETAAGWFRGPFLEGLELASCHRFTAWCVAQREELRAAHVALLQALAARLRHDPLQGLRAARALLALDPLAESSHLAVVQLLIDLGRPHEALEQYERCRRLLEAELHTRPSAELEALRIGLGAAPATPAPAPAAPRAAVGLPLVGREAECVALDQALAAARAGQGRQVLLVLGDPGVGKTRVLEELRRRAGAGALYGRAFEAELVRPYGAWIDALRSTAIDWTALPGRAELGALLPELGGGPGGDRNRLFEAVAGLLRALAARSGLVVVVLDDLQWLDEASAALLHFLARTLEGAPVLLAAAARHGEVEDNAAALRLVRGLEVDRRLRRLPLGPLAEGEVATLLAAAAPGVDAAVIHAESEGNPLFALELARSRAQGDPAATGTVGDLIAQRLGRLEERSRQVLPWAAALGRCFDPDILVRVTGLPAAELLAVLDDYERRGVVRSAGGAVYDFAHDLVRQAAYRQMSEPRRRLVHLQIARALAELPDPDGALAGELAHHAGLGGDDEQAASACVRAAERCLALFAHAEGSEVVGRGLQHAARLSRPARLRLELALLGKQVMNPLARSRRGREIAAELSRAILEASDAGLDADVALGLYARSVIEYHEGHLAAAYQSTVQAAAGRRAVQPIAAAEHVGSLAHCLLILEKDIPRAEELLREAQAAAGAVEDGEGDGLHVTFATSLLRQFTGDTDGALASFARAIALAARQGRRWEECDCITRAALLELEAGRPEAALARGAALLEVAGRMGEGSDRAGADTVLALARYALGHDEGGAGLAQALERLQRIDAKGLLAVTLTHAAEMDLAAGRPALALVRARAALAAATAVDRPCQAALARAVLARLALAEGDAVGAAALLDPLAPALARRLGLSERARRAVFAVYATLGRPHLPPRANP